MSEMQERINAIFAEAELPEEAELQWAKVICDGCGAEAAIENIMEVPRGWSLGEHGGGQDFCPRCRSGLDYLRS